MTGLGTVFLTPWRGRYSLSEPIIRPATKYFCKKGYIIKTGSVETITVAALTPWEICS